MIEVALLILIVLFVFGYITIPGVNIPNYHIYTFNHMVTLYEILILIVIFALLRFIPWYLRIITGALLIVWILSTLGFIYIKNLPAIAIVVLIFITIIHRSFHWYHRYYRREY